MTANLPEKPTAPFLNQLRNLIIVLTATVLAVGIFLGLRTESSTVSLTDLETDSIPYEVALENGKPTLMEFYANWCTSCMAMAPFMRELETEYAERVNFVMLNVDNTKWLPELTKYRVDGIPHFVFLGGEGEAIAEAIGEIPRAVMAENIEALIAGNPLPYAKAKGQNSALNSSALPKTSSKTDPRSHSAQVVN
ncbi:thioredoxin family protein [Laspinema olomoucense]|uniref:Thioredoxin family protein n=1 Tax=Laspinema olomoucense D3b TaxID=2953688 RepID=A0ABT2N6A1_9CYAN|nr:MULTISPECIES: thioredoxin family protein [unclassified Laspinema]MCT7970610.1 thioredoxin family protein [Laspinema sp. D3d]MCT7976895.1 thioredoxin family protein [Laspinema sp. D3b]MCT7989531.1 thioredoxin family protein [Laspinema sp. D3a]